MIKRLAENKSIKVYTVIGLILEIALILALRGSGARMSLLAGMVSIPAALVIIYNIFSSLEKALLLSLFCIPLLPLTGYIMLRLSLLDYQWLVYVCFYVVSAIALIKNGVIERIKNNNVKTKNKIIRILLSLFLVINVFFAFNKQLSFMVVTLSFLPFAIYLYIIKRIDIQPRKVFMDKVLYSVSLSCVLSSLPDLLFFIMYWLQGDRGRRGFGPLTGNSILMYDLIFLALILNKVVKEKKILNKWTYIMIPLLVVISTQISRGALLTFVPILGAYLIFNFKNWKIYVPILLIVTSLLSFNVMNRRDVAEDASLNELKDIIISDDVDADSDSDLGSSPLGNVILKIINSQSQSRQVIWKATINITKDYPYTGVGIGNLQYFYDDYASIKRGYTDAHNLMLNMSCEIGIPFMILAMILLIWIAINEFIKFFKEKNTDVKLNRLTMVIICGAIFVYGNLTGIALQQSNEIYSFTVTFVLMFLLMYRDCIEEF